MGATRRGAAGRWASRLRVWAWRTSTSRSSAPARATPSSTPELRGQAGRHHRGRHVRRHLPERRLHPDQDVRLRRRRRARRHHAAARLGVDATLDGVRWKDIRDRIFGRIDPISRGGQDYRRARRRTRPCSSRRTPGSPDPAPLEVSTGETITADQVVIAAGWPPRGPRRRERSPASRSTPPTRSCGSTSCPARMVILGGGYIAAEFAHVFSALRRARHPGRARRPGCCATSTPRSATAFTEIAAEPLGRPPRHRRGRARPRRRPRRPPGPRRRQHRRRRPAAGRHRPDARTPTDLDARPRPGSRPTTTAGSSSTRTSARPSTGVWALGDVSSPYQLKHVANHEARVVAHNLAHPDEPASRSTTASSRRRCSPTRRSPASG